MCKVLSSVNLLLFSFFLSSPHLALAWNGACYSPVQIASLLSKPKKKSNNTGKIRKSIRGLGKSIDKLEERLNIEEGRLAGSLDRKKLGESPSAVAGQIRSYMEASQNGWDCDDETARLLFEKYPLLFQSPLLFEILWQAFTPPAWGNLKKDGLGDGTDTVTGDCSGNLNRKLICQLEGCDGATSSQKKIARKQCETECEKRGREWNSSQNKCVDILPPEDDDATDDPLTGKEQCDLEERKWNPKGHCCPEGAKHLVNGNCSRCPENQGWDSDREECFSMKDYDKEKCDKKGAQYKWNRLKCILKCPKADEYWNTTKQKCEKICPDGKEWNKSKEKCVDILPPEDDDATDDPLTGKEQCDLEERKWNHHSNKCCPQGKLYIFNGKCVEGVNAEKDMEDIMPEEDDGDEGVSWDELKKHCKKRGDKWRWDEGKEECVSWDELKKQRCKGRSDKWGWDGGKKKCVLMCKKPGELWDSVNEECVPKISDVKQKQACEAKGARWFWNGAACLYRCPEWKKHPAFGRKGRVNKSFCKDFAKNTRECVKALARMKKLLRSLDKLESRRTKAEDSLFKAQMSSQKDSEEKTEAGGLCFSCLKRVLAASKSSTGQQVGNFLKVLTGAGLGLVGHNMGRRAQWDANMMRIQQTHAPQNDFYSMMGASAGFPFMAQGFYGMTRANTPVGGWNCSPTTSPHGHAHNYQYGQGINMVYY